MDRGKVGDVVWYVVGSDRQQAKIIAVSGSTHATIKLLTGPQSGQEFEAPWGVIEPCPRPTPLKGQMDQKKKEKIREHILQSKKLASAIDEAVESYFYGKPDPEVERLTTEQVDAIVEGVLGDMWN
ncbi:MAG: hypothetical protein ACLP56_02565 [Candidatus Sulfotelmatobacter sp.]